MEEQNVQTNQRPTFLTVLCILTFISSGLGVLFGIIGLVAAGAIESFAAYLPVGVDGGIVKSIISLVLVAASLYGAIQMWKLKKLGFYIYAAANVILLVMSFGIFGLIITAAFIVMYYLNLKAME
jgi:hypothetical protein